MRCIKWNMFDGPSDGPMGWSLVAMQLGWQANCHAGPGLMATDIPRITDAHQMVVDISSDLLPMYLYRGASVKADR